MLCNMDDDDDGEIISENHLKNKQILSGQLIQFGCICIDLMDKFWLQQKQPIL